MHLHNVKSVEEAFLLAPDLELSFSAPLNMKFTSKNMNQCSKFEVIDIMFTTVPQRVIDIAPTTNVNN